MKTLLSRFTLLLFFTLSAIADTIVVTTISDEDDGVLGNGTSLREAINHSPPESIIEFHPLIFSENKTIVISSELLIDRSLSIDASNLPEGVTIDGGGNGDFV